MRAALLAPAALAQQGYLKASNTDINDGYGYSLAVSGDTVVVGAPFEDSASTGVNADGSDNSALSAGAAYVYVRSGDTWTLQAYLKASNAGANYGFGHNVAIDGDTIVVGSYQEDSNGSSQSDTSANFAGAAYVFVRNGTTWSQQAYLKASNAQADDQFGQGIAIDGDTIVAGADQEDGSGSGPADESAPNAGAAYVFVRSGTVWSQQAYLKASNAGAGDYFGYSVDVDGDTIVVGASLEASNATGINGNQADNSLQSAGAAYVFVRSGTVWSQQAYLKASNTGTVDNFGYSVAVSGDTLLVSAPGEDSNATGVGGNQADNSALSSGAAYLFTRSGSVWSQQHYLKAANAQAGDEFGTSVALDGDTALIGAWNEDGGARSVDGNQADNSAAGAGAAYLFVDGGAGWSQQHYLKASNAESGDFFGYGAALDGGTMVASALWEDGAATGVDGDQSSNGVDKAGAAYVFAVTAAPPPPLVYLPLVRYSTLDLLVTINPSSIPTADAEPQGVVFYTTTITLPATLPDGGTFYLSSSPTAALPALVDDKITLRLGDKNGPAIFSHAYSTGNAPKPALVEVPRDVLEPYLGQSIYVEFKDVYGTVIRATPVYLVWMS